MLNAPNVNMSPWGQVTTTPADVQADLDRAANLVGSLVGAGRQLILDQLSSCGGTIQECLSRLTTWVESDLERARAALGSITEPIHTAVIAQLALAMAIAEELGIPPPPWLPQPLPAEPTEETGPDRGSTTTQGPPGIPALISSSGTTCAPGLCAGLTQPAGGQQAQAPQVPCDTSVRALGRPFPAGLTPFPHLPPGVIWDQTQQQLRIVDSSALASTLRAAGQTVLPFGGLILGASGYQLPVGAVGYEVPPLDYWCPFTQATAGGGLPPTAAPAGPAVTPEAQPAEPPVTPPAVQVAPAGGSCPPGLRQVVEPARVTVVSDDQGYLDSSQSSAYRSWLEGFVGPLQAMLNNPASLGDAVAAWSKLVVPPAGG